MTREEQIRAASDKWCSSRIEISSFYSGAVWADANPNPAREAAIQKLVEALVKFTQGHCTNASGCVGEHKAIANATRALEAWKEANK
jgi:hypothetical protein